MNIEAYNLDSIRKLVRDLQAENRELKQLLDNAGISYAQSEVFEAVPDKAPEYDVDQGARILPLNINRKTSPGIHVKLFDGDAEHFAVIDQEMVWHGGMNLLGKEEVWDNLIRTYDSGAASELLVMAFGSEG